MHTPVDVDDGEMMVLSTKMDNEVLLAVLFILAITRPDFSPNRVKPLVSHFGSEPGTHKCLREIIAPVHRHTKVHGRSVRCRLRPSGSIVSIVRA